MPFPHTISGGFNKMVKVLKFGGSSLADADQFRKVAEIVKSESERRYVVASAPGKRCSDDIKVTDMLYDCFRLASKKQNIDEAFKKI
jgi:aspartate kinase